MFREYIFLALACFCQVAMNQRLEKALLKMRQNKFSPRYLGPYSYLESTLDAGAVRDTKRDLVPDTDVQIPSDASEEVIRTGSQELNVLRNPWQQKKAYEGPKQADLDNSYFCHMPETEQKGATEVNESDYPWMARVIATDGREQMTGYEFMCTAVMLRDILYITAARCIETAKTAYTAILVTGASHPVRAFILPNTPSKQMFDDIGLIVIFHWNLISHKRSLPYDKPAHVIEAPRSGVGYDWFDKWNQDDYFVLGYVPSHNKPDSDARLYKLDGMWASNKLCNKILPAESNSNDYKVPCVHSCTADEHFQNDTSCHRYLFGLGHVVFDAGNRVIGVMTWTCGNHAEDRLSRNDLPLPVGIAVPNKDTLTTDYKCIDKILAHPHPDIQLVNSMDKHPTDLCKSIYE